MKLPRILLIVTLVTISILVVTTPVPVAAQDPGDGCAIVNDPFWDGLTSHIWSPPSVYLLAGDVVTIDAQPPDEPTGPTIFSFILGGATLGSQSYPGTLVIPITADQTVPGIEIMTIPETFVTLTVSCVPAPGRSRTPPAVTENPASAPVPGCDLGMQLTINAAGGTFVTDTAILWGPDANATTALMMPSGRTAWVLGVDDSGQFYKFVWSCNYLWAPVSAFGPNYDTVWNGAPLPTTVVK